MNYLAHAYLSFHQPEILVGNMISDYVKGKKKFNYSSEIQKGIALHRFIDTFTDGHPLTKKAKDVFRPVYRLYSGAFVDVVFDHFLANDKIQFPHKSLEDFTIGTYKILDNFTFLFPEMFQKMYPYMKSQNWLFNYQFNWGIEKSLGGVVRRSKYLTESTKAFQLFEENYALFQSCYNEFFVELKSRTKKQLDEMHILS